LEIENQDLPAVVVRGLAERGLTVALAESCTGGLAAHLLTTVPGASAVFPGAVVAYSDAVKAGILGVPASVLGEHGAVSSQAAAAMAEGARRAFGTSVAVAITGIAGPTGGSREKPVGTVWFGLAAETGTETWMKHFSGTRRQVQVRAADEALERIRRHCGYK